MYGSKLETTGLQLTTITTTTISIIDNSPANFSRWINESFSRYSVLKKGSAQTKMKALHSLSYMTKAVNP